MRIAFRSSLGNRHETITPSVIPVGECTTLHPFVCVARQPIPYAKSGVPRYAALFVACTFGIPSGGHMRLFRLLLAASLTVPTFAVAQKAANAANAANAAKSDPKMTFSVLKANVANITAPS